MRFYTCSRTQLNKWGNKEKHQTYMTLFTEFKWASDQLNCKLE